MAKNEKLFKLKQHVVENVQVTDSYTANTIIDLTTGQVDDSVVLSIQVETDNTAILELTIYRQVGSTNIKLGVFSVQVNQGSLVSTPPLELVSNNNIVSCIKVAGQPQIPLPSGQKLRYSLSAAPASGKIYNITVVRGDF